MLTSLMTRKWLVIIALLAGIAAALLFLAGCQSAQMTLTPTPSRTFAFRAYHTATASLTPTQPTRAAAATIPVTPSPTATPFLHTIKKDETMLGIALTYGVELTDLLAANPAVDPHFMSIGVTLTIPISPETAASVPVITPVPLELDEPACYRSADGGAWCFALAHNDLESAVENVSAVIGLFSDDGENIAAQAAVPPLNRIGPGDDIPLAVFFPPPLPGAFTAQVELLTAISINEQSGRYLNASVSLDETEILAGALAARVTGQVELLESDTVTQTLPARVIWITAVAYDEAGNMAGVRKWESSSQAGCALPAETPVPGITPTPGADPYALLPEECFRFDLTVYSLGPPITRVQVFAEVRP